MTTTRTQPTKRRSVEEDQMMFTFGDKPASPGERISPPEPEMPKATRKPSAKKTKATKTTSDTPTAKPKKRVFATAESMSKAQREISVSEFFAKNRHLLGFDNKRKALLTTVKEAVDNSLDACEEAGILPDIYVRIAQTDNERYAVTIRDNGPGIVKQQIPNIFGKLLYGSKFHRLKMSRGQQGIGISAAGMYGLLTTGRSVKITSRTGRRTQAHYYELQIDTKGNKPHIVKEQAAEVEWDHGTEVTIELVAQYLKGRASVDEYLELTAIGNPHASFTFVDPSGAVLEFARGTETPPEPVQEIKPHPYGIELGVLIKMLKDAREKTVAQFLSNEFSRVSPATAAAICKKAKVSARANPTRVGTHEAETLYKAMQETNIKPPATNCLSPIGPEQILAGLLKGVRAEFFTASSRPPAVYRGNPFQIEAGLAYGGELGPDPAEEKDEEPQNEARVRRGKVVKQNKGPSPAKLMRFANRVPLLFQASGCCVQKSVCDVDWRRYGLSQPSGNLPVGPMAIFVHMASVWVPFTSEGKEAIADYDEIRKEIKLAVQDCARKLSAFLNRRRKQKYEADRRNIFGRYIAEVAAACESIDPDLSAQAIAEDLMAVAQRVTARADEKVELISAKGRGAASNGDSEYGDNTVVLDGANGEAGPLFNGDESSDDES
ncbi:MAG TPA: DNA topoisomerase VI subunit B [Phycisphaerae bacterium]|nr:DNA topoisomerase VI subunit B [Phycisphaerae bacterium]HRW52015.1 DNA topoisomerase VI subunit B [Phycisphaerae bacterium]